MVLIVNVYKVEHSKKNYMVIKCIYIYTYICINKYMCVCVCVYIYIYTCIYSTICRINRFSCLDYSLRLTIAVHYVVEGQKALFTALSAGIHCNSFSS